MDQKRESLANLQEAFRGSLEPEVVYLILTESNYNVDVALEKLLSLSSPVLSSDNNIKSTGKSYMPGKEDFSQPNGYETTDGTAYTADKKIHVESDLKDDFLFGSYESDSLSSKYSAPLPKGQIDSNIDVSTAVSIKEANVDLAGQLVNSLPFKKDLCNPGNVCLEPSTKTTTTFVEKCGNPLSTAHKLPESSDPSFTDSFILQQVTSTDDWSSISNPIGIHQVISPHNSQETLDHKLNRTPYFNSGKTKQTLEQKDSFFNDDNIDLRTSQAPKNDESEVPDQQLTTNELPPWPDCNQRYLMHPQIQPLHGNLPTISQGIPNSQNFTKDQNQAFIGNMGFSHYRPQFQFHPNMANPKSPLVNNSFSVTGIRHWPVGWHPGQNMMFKGQTGFRATFQPAIAGMRQPIGYYTQGKKQNTFPKTQTRKRETLPPPGKVLVIMRGLPGSGKTTLAKSLKGDGLILSTDDYFIINEQYQFEGIGLADAHEWNQKRAIHSMERGVSPIIIDNTNTQAWEMRPYVSMAHRFGYQVILREPDTPWKWNAKELFRRNQHNVTMAGIKNMKERYEKDLTVDKILGTNSIQKTDGEIPKVEIVNLSNKMEAQERSNEQVKPVLYDEQEGSSVTRNSQVKSTKGLSSVCKKGKSDMGIIVKLEMNKHKSKAFLQSPSPASSQQSTQNHKTAIEKNLERMESKIKKTLVNRQEIVTLRSHGSRSPVQDFDFEFSLSELSTSENDKTSETNSMNLSESDNDDSKEDLTDNLLPKPQRMPKSRERRATKAAQILCIQKNGMAEDNHDKVANFDKARQNVDLCVKNQVSEGESSVKVMSDYGEDKDNTKETDLDGEKSSKTQEKPTSDMAYQTQSLDIPRYETEPSEENKVSTAICSEVTDENSHQEEIHIKQMLIPFKEENNGTDKNDSIFHDKESEKPDVSNQEDLLFSEKTIPMEAPMKEMMSEKDECELDFCSSSHCEDGDVSDNEDEKDSPDIISSMSKAFLGLNASSKDSKVDVDVRTSREEGPLMCSQVQSESELNGFQFLNTCFPDMDVQVLCDVLVKQEGDVTKAVNSILSLGENNRPGTDPEKQSYHSSSGVSSVMSSVQTSSTQLDQNLTQCIDESLLGSQTSHTRTSDPLLQESNTRVVHGHKSFQMTLEPAVALHLMELFGPIDGVNFDDDFSTDDLIIKVDSHFAKLLYDQWKTTIQVHLREVFSDLVFVLQSVHTGCVQKKSKEKFVKTDETQQQSQASRKKQSSNKQKKHLLASRERHQASDLREIMNEQMALERSRKEQDQSDDNMGVVLKRQKLYAMFPGLDPLALEELFQANRYKLEPTVSMVETSCDLKAKPMTMIETALKETQNDFNLPASDNVKSPKEQKTAYQALEDPDYADFRAEANTHYKLREECFRKAAFAFSKKQGQLAQFYASQGHMHTEKIKQANSRAAARILEHKCVEMMRMGIFHAAATVAEITDSTTHRLIIDARLCMVSGFSLFHNVYNTIKASMLLEKLQGELLVHIDQIKHRKPRLQNADSDQNTLDLHGLHVNEALLALEERLTLPDTTKNHSRFLSVITGKGMHSKQGKAKIKPAVLEYLQSNNYRFEELQPGLVRVFLNR